MLDREPCLTIVASSIAQQPTLRSGGAGSRLKCNTLKMVGCCMENHSSQLSSEERNMIQRGLNERLSKRAIARLLNRSASTVTREINRFMSSGQPRSARSPCPQWARYEAARAAQASRARRRRGPRKLAEGAPLRAAVIEQLQEGWSPEQIAGRLRSMSPEQATEQVCHETIYSAIYATPKGELRKSLISQLRRAHKQRLPRTRGHDRRGQLPDMVSIHDRPEEVTDRLVPGHWEGDLIKGAGNRSAVGILVERTSRYVILVKMDGTDAQAALDGFTRAFKAVPFELRKTLTYDQGKEMARHVDLAQFTQHQLVEIAWSLNNRPRKILGFLKPEEVFSQLINDLTKTVALQT